MTTNTTPHEHGEQAVFVEWLTLRGIAHCAVDNEQHKNKAFALDAWRRKQGFLKGAPDLVILALAPKTKRPVVVEMKREKGGVHSEAQQYVAAICRRNGIHYLLAPGADDAIGQMVDLGFALSRGPQWPISADDQRIIFEYETRSTKPKRVRRRR